MTAKRTGRAGRYRPSRKRRFRTVLATLTAAAVAVAVLVAMGARAISARNSCNEHPVVANIAVSGAIATVVARAADVYNRGHHKVTGQCVQVAVQTMAPATVLAALGRATGAQQAGGQQTGAQQAGGQRAAPDGWIPDSQLWVDLARGPAPGAALVHPLLSSVASSPLVIVMPRRAAARMPAYGTSVGWRFLLPQTLGGPSAGLGLHVQFPDPAQDGAGLATLVGLRSTFGHGRPARTALAAFASSVQVVPPASAGAPLASLAGPLPEGNRAPPVTVTSEQAAIAFDQAHPGQPLALRYPREGTYEFTYPYAVTTNDPVRAAIARQFASVLRSPYVTAYTRYAGFRSSGGALGTWPAAFGTSSTMPRLLPAPGPAKAAAALRAWRRLTLGLRLLTLIDVSSVMATPAAPGGPTLEQVFAKSASIGLARLPDSTQLGLWEFASNVEGSQTYRQVVSVGPLPGAFGLVSRRQQIERLNKAAVPMAGHGAAIYGTILAAYHYMVSTYQPQYSNTMILMTAGVEASPGDIPVRQLVRQLKQLYNRQQNIEILAIQLGRLGNFAALRQVAAATNGKAYELTKPSQINGVVFQAMGRRICQPHCPAGPSR